MKTQEEIRAEFDDLLEQDRLEEAAVLAEQIILVSAEEFRRRLDEAPYDDEPVTPEQQRHLHEVHTRLTAMRRNTVESEFGRALEQPLAAGDRAALERARTLLRAL